MLIPLVDGPNRKRLVIARVQAMRYGCSAGMSFLGDDTELQDVSRVGLFMQRCELLYLDHQHEAACDLYDTEIEPLLERLSPECAALLADNRTTLSLASFNLEESNQFYHQVDIRRLLGVDLRNSGAELEADRSAAAGKHYEALPAIWKLLIDAYRKQNWRALGWAHSRMARECMALNWPDEAVWHAVQGLNKDLVIEAASLLAASRDNKRIKSGIDRLLMFSQLAQHSSLTAAFLYEMADCIPDDRVARVMEWVSPHLDFIPTSWAGAWLFEPIWKVIGSLARRINPDLALQIAQRAASHGVVVHKTTFRKHLINSCGWLFERISPEHLDQFVAFALSLVTTHKSDIDFNESLGLVCYLAGKSASCRDKLRAALFPPGIAISHPTLLEIAPSLGWHPENHHSLNENAVNIAMTLRKQVEVLEAAAEPSKLGGFGQIMMLKDTEKIVVHIGGAQHWIDAIVAHLSCLNDNSVRCLVQAILEMIADNRNIVSNRISLLQSLRKLTPRLPSDLAEAASQLISDIAKGNFSESEVSLTYQDAINPLNPFKINVGDPYDLRGIALLTLTDGSKVHHTFSSKLHSGLLLNFLEVDNEKLRRFGVLSAQTADSLSESEVTALITSSFDRSPEVRKLAFQGLASVMSVNMDQQSLRLGVQAVRRASDSGDAEERAAAAKAANVFLKYAANDNEIRGRLTAILNLLSGDVSHYVRSCALGN